jgi:hypothetical protein
MNENGFKLRQLQMESLGRERAGQIYEQALALAYQMVPGLESLSERIGQQKMTSEKSTRLFRPCGYHVCEWDFTNCYRSCIGI